MMIVSALVTAFTRLVGGVAEMTVGWAVVLLFGRVPQSRQTLLAWIGLGSMLWLGAVIALVVPGLGQALLGAVPRPGFVAVAWLAWVLLACATLLPLTVGAATVAVTEAADRPGGLRLVGQVLRGYAYAAVMAVTILFLAAVSLERKLRSLQHGWQSDHLPLIIRGGRYPAVVNAIESALRASGLEVRRRFANRAFDVPPHLLAAVGGRGVGSLIPDRLVELRVGDGGELGILVYPSDLALLGPARVLVRARAAMATGLAFSDAYLTRSKEAEAIEDRLAELRRTSAGTAADFAWVDETLDGLVIPYDDWETLYRLRLQAEIDARAGSGRVAVPLPATDDRARAGELAGIAR